MLNNISASYFILLLKRLYVAVVMQLNGSVQVNINGAHSSILSVVQVGLESISRRAWSRELRLVVVHILACCFVIIGLDVGC